MVATLDLQVEVVGCPTVRRHCWAQGVPYPAMPVADIAWVLEQAQRFCDDHRLGFGAYPMHELAAHPQAAEVLGVFADHVGAAEFEPLSTTGVPLAVRQDWQELLATAARLGTTTVWVAFHGLGVEHDRQVNRPGAFAETGLAVQRVHAVGLRAGANVFVTTANAGQAERLRPELSDLVPLADRIGQLSPFHGEAWANLEAHTEAAWVARAVAGDWPAQLAELEPRAGGHGLPLVCRPGLDVHTGVAGRYGERHGNLRSDGAHAMLGRALDQGGRSIDAVWFGPDRLPAVEELAARSWSPAACR
jgi:hypothetical protein